MKNRLVVLILLILVIMSVALFLFGVFYYWSPTCASSLHSGLLGASLGVFITGVLALIAYWQLSNISKTNSADFIHRLKNDFFTEPTRILVDHIIENRLLFKEISGEDPKNNMLKPSRIEMAYFEVDQTRILTTFPEKLREQLSQKRYYLEVEIDDLLLGPFEDIGLFEERCLIDTDMAYEEFSYYVIGTFENEEIKRYIGDPDFCTQEQEFRLSECKATEDTIRSAYEVISKDISVGPLPADYSPIEALNELLRMPNLCEKIVKAKKGLQFTEQVRSMINETRKLRKKSFSDLDGAEQRRRKALNRLLLEEAYPDLLPKNAYIRSDEFDADMWSKLTYLYNRFKDIEAQRGR